MAKVVPLNTPHKLNRGDAMEMKIGNVIGIIKPCEDSEEEQELARYQTHMALWAIHDEIVEKEEAS